MAHRTFQLYGRVKFVMTIPDRFIRQLQQRFEELLLAELDYYGGVPHWDLMPCGHEQIALREAISEVLLAEDDIGGGHETQHV